MTEAQRHIHTAPYRDSPELRAQRWIGDNMWLFKPAVQEFITASLKKARRETRGLGLAIREDFFDSQRRLPEEMPICTMWKTWSRQWSVPLGFQVSYNSVLIENEEDLDYASQGRRVDHQYLEALDGSEIIIDHCAAQFHKRVSVSVPKGGRLAALQARAGDLTKTFTNEGGDSHTFLIGTRSDIVARLGLRYDTVPRYES